MPLTMNAYLTPINLQSLPSLSTDLTIATGDRSPFNLDGSFAFGNVDVSFGTTFDYLAMPLTFHTYFSPSNVTELPYVAMDVTIAAGDGLPFKVNGSVALGYAPKEVL